MQMAAEMGIRLLLDIKRFMGNQPKRVATDGQCNAAWEALPRDKPQLWEQPALRQTVTARPARASDGGCQLHVRVGDSVLGRY
ncbi:hypothetical protein ACOMHN_020262 [Nucella lapillus]